MDPTLNEENTEASTETGEGESASAAVGTMLDAINESLEPKSAVTDTSAESVDTDTEAEEEVEGEEAAEGEEGGLARGPDGKFTKKPAEGEKPAAVDPNAAKPGEKPGEKAAAAAKKADPVNDPIPEGVSQRTRERMTSLVDMVKQKDVVLEQQAEIFRAIERTGTTPEDFGAMVTYLQWRNSDDIPTLTKARDMVVQQLRDISLKLGEAPPGVDFISEHPDLVQKVNSGQITYDVAHELAMTRTRTKTEAERAQRTQQQTQQQTVQQKQQRDNAILELNDLGATLEENDPLFPEIMKLMPDLSTLGKNAAPAQWKGVFMAAYKAAKVQVQKAAGGTAAPPAGQGAGAGNSNPAKPQPLRANKQPSGGQSRQATSLQDAIFGDGFPT